MLSSLLLSGGGGAASEDTYAVQDYLTSRDAAHYLIQTQNLKSVFDRTGADFLARFPGLMHGMGFERFYVYYQNHVTAELDSTTNISTLKVRTFRADDSQRIARALLSAAEQLINRMNERQRKNLISAAQREVDEASDHLHAIGVQVATYRNREALLDPMKQSVPMLKDISELQTTLTTTRVQLAQVQKTAPDSPLIPIYQQRIQAVQAQIKRSNLDITGNDSSLVPKITAYDELTLQQQFGEKTLANAILALETAKTQADRQQLYLDEITLPNEPDFAAYPRRIVSVAIAFISFLGLFLMGKLLISGIREHGIT